MRRTLIGRSPRRRTRATELRRELGRVCPACSGEYAVEVTFAVEVDGQADTVVTALSCGACDFVEAR